MMKIKKIMVFVLIAALTIIVLSCAKDESAGENSVGITEAVNNASATDNGE